MVTNNSTDGSGQRKKFFPPPLLGFGRKPQKHAANNPNALDATTRQDTTAANSATSSGNSRTTSMEAILGLEIGFENLYTLDRKLNSGSFASVWVGIHKISSAEFAVKVVDRKRLKPKDDAAVYREVSILKSLSGSYDGIINLIDFFEEPQTFHLILELARGGDVFDRLSKRTVYTEKHARDLARRMLEAVQYIHSYGIVHRDLKPENLLLVDDINDSNIKLGDFGFAKRLADAPEGLRTRCGTPAFVAPEILLGVPYGSSVDMWSCGVILYLLLGGYPPFQAENSKALFRKIRAADYVFHDKYWDNVSIEAKQLIASLLQVDPNVRYDASAALRSNWMKIDDEDLSESDLSGSLSQMRKFNAKRKLKGAMHAVRYAAHAKFWDIDQVSFGTAKKSAIGSSAASGSAGLSPWANGSSKLTGGKVGKTFKDLYELQDKVRSGSFATIWRAKHRESGVVWAVKVVSRKELKPKDDAQFLQEVAILLSLRHKNIVALNDFFEEKEYFYLVMELLEGGDVFDRIVEKNHYTELDARDLARELLSAVAYMHARGVAHRDLKPQNLLLVSMEDNSAIKVADFGFAKRVHVPNSLMTRCGTPTYVAPEVLKNHPHDEMVDMWSVGIIIYVLLVGYPPFMEENQRQLFRKIRMGEYEFFQEDWADISEPAKDLISKLLVVDPSRRIKAQAALQHEWICKVDDDDLSARSLSSSLDSLRSSLKSIQTEEGYTAEWLIEGREMIQ